MTLVSCCVIKWADMTEKSSFHSRIAEIKARGAEAAVVNQEQGVGHEVGEGSFSEITANSLRERIIGEEAAVSEAEQIRDAQVEQAKKDQLSQAVVEIRLAKSGSKISSERLNELEVVIQTAQDKDPEISFPASGLGFVSADTLLHWISQLREEGLAQTQS